MLLTEEQDRALERMSAERHEPKAALVRRAVDLLLTQEAAETRQDARRRAREAVGKFNSGLGDVARNHDAYLGEVYRA